MERGCDTAMELNATPNCPRGLLATLNWRCVFCTGVTGRWLNADATMDWSCCLSLFGRDQCQPSTQEQVYKYIWTQLLTEEFPCITCHRRQATCPYVTGHRLRVTRGVDSLHVMCCPEQHT